MSSTSSSRFPGKVNFSIKRQKRQMLDIRDDLRSSNPQQQQQSHDVSQSSPSSSMSGGKDISPEERISLFYSLIDSDGDESDSEEEVEIDFAGFTEDQIHRVRNYELTSHPLTSDDETDIDDGESESDQEVGEKMSRKRRTSGRKSHNSPTLTLTTAAASGKQKKIVNRKDSSRKSSKKHPSNHNATTSSSSNHNKGTPDPRITSSLSSSRQLSSPSSVSLSPLVSWSVNGDGDAATNNMTEQTSIPSSTAAADSPVLDDHVTQVDDHEVVSKHKQHQHRSASRSSKSEALNDMLVHDNQKEDGGGGDEVITPAAASQSKKRRNKHKSSAKKTAADLEENENDGRSLSPGPADRPGTSSQTVQDHENWTVALPVKKDKKQTAISEALQSLQKRWRERVIRSQQADNAGSPVTPGSAFAGCEDPESPAGSFSGGSSARVPGGILREARLQVDESTLNQIRTQTSDDSDGGDESGEEKDDHDDGDESDVTTTDVHHQIAAGENEDEDDENNLVIVNKSSASSDKKSRNRSKSSSGRKRKRTSSSRSRDRGKKHSPKKKNPGTIECVICSAIKYYSHKQRRFGVFACETCAKFFSNFMRDPKAYYCNNTGDCLVNEKVTAPDRCRACWLKVCLQKFEVNPEDRDHLTARNFLPKLKSEPHVSLIAVDTSHKGDHQQQQTHSMEGSGTEASTRRSRHVKQSASSNKRSHESAPDVRTDESSSGQGLLMLALPQSGSSSSLIPPAASSSLVLTCRSVRGPRVKTVCRSTATGLPRATFSPKHLSHRHASTDAETDEADDEEIASQRSCDSEDSDAIPVAEYIIMNHQKEIREERRAAGLPDLPDDEILGVGTNENSKKGSKKGKSNVNSDVKKKTVKPKKTPEKKKTPVTKSKKRKAADESPDLSPVSKKKKKKKKETAEEVLSPSGPTGNNHNLSNKLPKSTPVKHKQITDSNNKNAKSSSSSSEKKSKKKDMSKKQDTIRTPTKKSPSVSPVKKNRTKSPSPKKSVAKSETMTASEDNSVPSSASSSFSNSHPFTLPKTIAPSKKVINKRCGQCTGCKADDCGGCVTCKDKKRFGGPGLMKQACRLKRCVQMPESPHSKKR